MTANAKLRLNSSVLAYGDAATTNDPRKRFVDWKRDIVDLDVTNPSSLPKTLAPSEAWTVFNGQRTLLTDNTTSFDLVLVPGTVDRFRFKWVGGTNPVFRTDRALALNGATVAVTQTGNGVAQFALSGGPTFAGVVAGDILYVAPVNDIGSSPFHEANQGFWVVLVATSTALTVTRLGEFEMASDPAVALTTNSQVQAFSAAGVQAGDDLDVTGGFAPYNQRTLNIVSVTSTYLEVEASLSLAPEAGAHPSAAGFVVYSDAKRYVRVESDQDCVVQVNADSSLLQRVTPWVSGDPDQVGEYVRTGLAYSLVIVNRSTQPANVLVVSCE